MLSTARLKLNGAASQTVSLGRVIYHSEGIVLPISPVDVLAPIFEAAQAATLEVRWLGSGPIGSPGWSYPYISEDVSRDDVPFAVRVGLGVLVRGSCAGLVPRPAAFALAGVILGG